MAKAPGAVEGGTAMTTEEAIKHLHTYSSTNGSGLTTQDQHEEAKKMAITALEQPGQRWIPCSERLPEAGQDVMISVGGMYSAEGCLRDDGDWYQFRWSAIIPNDRVTAWCELPEPYKGGDADGRP